MYKKDLSSVIINLLDKSRIISYYSSKQNANSDMFEKSNKGSMLGTVRVLFL